MLKIEKRDGRIVEFDEGKIVDAITKALYEVGDRSTNPQEIALDVVKHVEEMERITVEKVQDVVEKELMKHSPSAAKAFILYRDERTRERRYASQFYQDINKVISPKETRNDNANIDDFSFGGRKFGASGIVHKEIGKSMMHPEVRNAFEQMWLYIHDMDSYDVGMHNCLLIDMQKLLSEGFSTRNTDVRPANSFATACQLVAVIFQAESQFGSAR